MARTALFSLIVSLVLAACGGGPPIANRCPGSREPKCLTRTICELDKSRGCQVCQCESAGIPPVGAPTGPVDPTR